MPMDKSKYPDNWDEIALSVKTLAGWRCQICGKQCRKPGEMLDTHRRTLTTMHLDHDESNCESKNLLAGCASCHCRYDARTKGEWKKYGLKTVYVYDDLAHVQRLVYNDRRRAFLCEHDRWPRGEENDRLWDMPDISRFRASSGSRVQIGLWEDAK